MKNVILKRFAAIITAAALMCAAFASCAGTTAQTTGSDTSSASTAQQSDSGATKPDASESDASQSEASQSDSAESDTTDTVSPDAAGAVDIDSLVSSMPLREKFTQLMSMDFREWTPSGSESALPVTVLNDELRAVMEKYKFGGVVLFSPNYDTTDETVRLIDDMQNTGDIPLLVSSDDEGGTIVRRAYGTAMPGNMLLGASGNVTSVRKAAEITGRELIALGINLCLAPVLDVNVNSASPIGTRSFGESAEDVAKYGAAYVDSLQTCGVTADIAACAKHFPGLGMTETDSHTGLPTSDKTLEQLRENELLPYKSAIESGINVIMAAHISLPNVESGKAVSKADGSEITLPASLSKTVITDVLRGELGFDGVVMTDALNMGAISDNFGVGEACVLALNAGVDILTMPVIVHSQGDVAKLDSLLDYLESAVSGGTLAEATIDAALRRVLTLKYETLKLGEEKQSVDQRAETAEKYVGSDENKQIEREITAEGITVLKDDSLTFVPSDGETVLFLYPYDNERKLFDIALERLQSEDMIGGITAEFYCYNKETELDSKLKKKLSAADYVIMVAESSDMNDAESWTNILPHAVCEYVGLNKRLAVICAAKPYEAENYREIAPSILCCYGARGASSTITTDVLRTTFGPNIPAAVDVIFGRFSGSGRLPVTVSDSYPIGSSVGAVG